MDRDAVLIKSVPRCGGSERSEIGGGDNPDISQRPTKEAIRPQRKILPQKNDFQEFDQKSQ
ncbi:unnamed protein product [Tenebrio molitor]|nr:unnamed protein product [Tenebrio molitor]